MAFDILFFEALGEENEHLKEGLEQAKRAGTLPASLTYLITTETLQDYLAAHPETELPDILSIKTHSVPPREWYENAPKKSILSRSAGYDHIEALQDRVNCTSLRRYCVNAVAETALKFVFAACGNLNEYQKNTATFERNRCLSFKELSGLKAAVFGVGKIGSRVYEMLKGLGLTTVGVDIRAKELAAEYGGRVDFAELKDVFDADIVVNCMNYTKNPASRFYNEGYFSREILSSFKPGFVFVNVTRGEITDEAALLDLYQKGAIFGIGLDTFSHEAEISRILNGAKKPETETEKAQAELIRLALSREGNIYTQPHQGFNSDIAAADKAAETIRHLEAYYRNGCRGFDSQLPYYL